MTAQPIWRSSGSSRFRAEVGVRFGDELEFQTTAPDPVTDTVIVIGRRDVAALADALYRWLRETPPGRGGVIVSPYEYAHAAAALVTARDMECERDGCGHRMGVHSIGSKPDRPSPCMECHCPAFR